MENNRREDSLTHLHYVVNVVLIVGFPIGTSEFNTRFVQNIEYVNRHENFKDVTLPS